MSDRHTAQNLQPGPGFIMDIAAAFRQSRILLTAYELDVFSAIGDNPKTADQVATIVKANPRAIDRLLNALCTLGLLTKAQKLFANTPDSAAYLVKTSPHFLSGLQHTVHLWDRWSTLTAAVTKGGTVLNDQIEDRDDGWIKAFIAAMHSGASRWAEPVAASLDLRQVRKLLDVGGGSGAFSMAFVRSQPSVHATVFDLPQVISLTRAYIQQAGLQHCIDTCPGNYHRDAFGTGFDLVFLSSIIHINSFEENNVLIAKAAQAVAPNGQVVVRDFVMDETRTSPLWGAHFALNMLVGTEAGDTYTESEIKEWMSAAGLTELKRINPAGDSASLIVGRKAIN